MNIIQQIEREQMNAVLAKRGVPEFSPGDTVKVTVKVVETAEIDPKDKKKKAAAPKEATVRYPQELCCLEVYGCLYMLLHQMRTYRAHHLIQKVWRGQWVSLFVSSPQSSTPALVGQKDRQYWLN